MDRKRTISLCLAIVAAAAVLVTLVFTTEPDAERAGATRETAMLVETVRVRRGSHVPVIEAMGTVEAARDVTLSPRVEGRVVERAEALVPGGRVAAGEVLLRIDPADYENALRARRTELSRARADLEIERGRQEVAQREYELLGEDLEGTDAQLVLREPQLDAARARVEAARAAVARAELDLERTTIRAPFDAQILERRVEVGSRVAPGDALVRLVGLDHYWVEATLPLSDLEWVRFPDAGGPGDDAAASPVRIHDESAWGPDQMRQGHLYRLVGALEDGTRMARVLVTVPDPLALETEDADAPPLMIGAFVEARIEARRLDDVVRIDRDHVRQGDTAWVMADGALRIRELDVRFRDARFAYVADGLEDGDAVVTTSLATVTEGAALRVEAGETTP